MEKTTKKKILEWALCIAIAGVLALLINIFVIYKVKIPSSSMVPTLNVDDRLFATRVYNPENLERGDIVVFYSDELNERMIKRLIGIPGDKISIKNGVVNVNGETLKDEYVVNVDTKYTGDFEVPENKYFFLGDNRRISKDSRLWKNPYIDADKIEGKAQFRVYPFSDIGFVE